MPIGGQSFSSKTLGTQQGNLIKGNIVCGSAQIDVVVHKKCGSSWNELEAEDRKQLSILKEMCQYRPKKIKFICTS